MAGVKLSTYDFEKKLSKVIKSIENSNTISKNSKEEILKFKDTCLAEGLSKARTEKYLYHLEKLATWLKKDFKDATKEDILNLIGKLEGMDYSEWHKHDYKVALKKFYKIIKGNGEEYPEQVRWLRTSIRNNHKKLPEELLTEEEVLKLIETADHPRDKALISLLYETGMRTGELLSLRIKHVEFNNIGGTVIVKGKTGMRKVMIVSSVPYIASWLQIHPKKDNPESPLWTVKGNYKEGHGYITYKTFLSVMGVLSKKSGIKKRIHPHLFRHSRATQMANHLTEAQMNQYFGWVQGSDMPATYVHLSGRDMEAAIKKFYGIETPEEEKEVKMKPIKCSKCENINAPAMKFCGRCGGVLDVETAIELQEKRRQSDEIMNALLEDPKIKKMLVKKLLTTELGKKMMKLKTERYLYKFI